jgi:CubicO group peptidase (beta-lactamase class C family)
LYESWALRDTRTTAPPGEYFYYSNIGYKTLGFLLERLTNQSLQEVIQSRILDPLSMTQTHPTITLETRRITATGYCGFYDDRPEHTSHKLVPATWAEYGTGDGCVASTAGDMAIYLRMLLNRGRGPQGPLISAESFDSMTRQGIWTGTSYYGYGLGTYIIDGRPYICHGGGNAGYRSAVAIDIESGFGVVFLLNSWGETGPVVAAAQHVLTVRRAEHLHQDLPPLPPTTDPGSIQNAQDYTGTYEAGDRVLILTAEDGKLVLKHNGRRVALERRDLDSFYVAHPDFDLFLPPGLSILPEAGRPTPATI